MQEITLEKLGLKFEVGGIIAGKEGWGDRKPWYHIAFRCTFAAKDSNRSVTQTYKMGIGHFMPHGRMTLHREDEFMQLPLRRSFCISKLNPMEVLNCLCRDGLEAFQNSFRDWCDCFGYDSDSIQARDTFNQCIRIHEELTLILSHKQIRDVAALEF